MRKIEMIFPLKGIASGRSIIQTETFGYVGQACKTATEGILRSLGGQQEEQLKSEYYAVQDQAIERVSDGSS
jgi:Protein of unknown function (DUF2997)